MAQMDMGFSPIPTKGKKHKKKKQSFGESLITGLFPSKGDTTAEITRKIVFLLALVILIAAIVMIILQFSKEYGGKDETDRFIIDLKNKAPTQEHIDQLPQGTIDSERFAELYAENNDFIGWLTIPGTNIDYPVMQHPEKDYYLHRNFQKQNEFSGTLFVDHKGKITKDSMPQNTIIYGHNMLYKYQFSALMNYKRNIDFLKVSPTIEFDTLFSNNQYKIISVFMTNIYEEHGEVFDYTNKIYFTNPNEFFDYVLQCEDRSIYETGVDVQYGDELVTLSTCDQDTAFEARLVIVARKVRLNESPEVDTDKIVKKNSIKYFDAYYKAYGQIWKGRTWDTSVVKGLDDYIKQNHLEDNPEDYE